MKALNERGGLHNGKKSYQEASGQRMVGLITTQLLTEGVGLNAQSKSTASNNNPESQRAESKLSILTENNYQSEDNVKKPPNTIFTDPKINLFNGQQLQQTQSFSRKSVPDKYTPLQSNHQVRAARTPIKQQMKSKHKGATASQPASRRENDSFLALENQHRGGRTKMSQNSSRAHSQSTTPKENTPRSTRV